MRGKLIVPIVMVCVLAVALVVGFLGSKAEAGPANLKPLPSRPVRGGHVEGTIQIIWSFNKWPADLLGFDVYRRPAGSADEGAWKKVNESTVRPDTTAERVRELGLSRVEHSVCHDANPQRPFEGFVDLYREYGPAELFQIDSGMSGLEDAQSYGFSYRDKQIEAGKAYEYQVVPRFQGETARGTPLCSIVVQRDTQLEPPRGHERSLPKQYDPVEIDYSDDKVKTSLEYYDFGAKTKKWWEFQYVVGPNKRKWRHGDYKLFANKGGNLTIWQQFREGEMHGIQRLYPEDGDGKTPSHVFIFDSGKRVTREAYEKAHGKLTLTPDEEKVLRGLYPGDQ